MEPLSRNKKIGILSLVVVGLTIVGLFGTGNLSFSGLKSDVLGNTCTEQKQQAKLPQYTDFINKRIEAQKIIDIASGEIVVLQNKIAEHKNTIEKKKAQMVEKNAKIDELTTYIEKSCKRPKGTKEIALCQKKKQQKRDLGQDVQLLKNSITSTNNTILILTNQIKNRQNTITRQLALIAKYTVFINEYESCDRQLQTKPILTSPLMSGEARISGEVLVSGEVCISSEVLISGEVHISGEVNVPVYRLAINAGYPSKAAVEQINYYLSKINTATLQVTDWFVAEERTPNTLYKCSFVDPDNTQLRCLPGTQALVNSETRNYILYARVKAITGVGSFKVYSAHIVYNKGKEDSINYTTPIKINYTSQYSKCPVVTPSVTVLSPNGGEKYRSGDTIAIKWNSAGLSSSYPVRIEIGYTHNDPTYPAGRNFVDWIIEKTTNTGLYKWTIPEYYSMGITPGSFSIRIVADSIIRDSSDTNFTIVQDGEQVNTIAVNTNDSGYYNGDIVNIQWLANKLEQYGINLVKKNDPSFLRFLKPAEGVSGNITWKIPSDIPMGYDYQIRVTEGLYRNNVGHSLVFAIKPNSNTACTDSDRGDNIYTQGVTRGQKGPNDTTVYSRTDFCAVLEGSSDELQACSGDNCGVNEFVCTSQNNVTFVSGNRQKCPNGCSNGACIMPDTTPPMITFLNLPSLFSATKVPLSIATSEKPVSYLMIDGPTPKDGLVPALPPTPSANDARWSNIIPTSYNFTGIGARTLFAWIKDVAGNVSNSKSANTVISICPAISAPVCNEGEEMIQGSVDVNGCPFPPKCVPIIKNAAQPETTMPMPADTTYIPATTRVPETTNVPSTT